MVAVNGLDNEHLQWGINTEKWCKKVFFVCLFTLSGVWLSVGAHLGHTHLVGGECAGLVGADDRGAAQGFHRRQASDNGVLLGHTAGTKSEAGCDDSGQT